jgi:hypothetical protein
MNEVFEGENGFHHASDLVRFIKQKYGSTFTIAVAGTGLILLLRCSSSFLRRKEFSYLFFSSFFLLSFFFFA